MFECLLFCGSLIAAIGGAFVIRVYAPLPYGQAATALWFSVWAVAVLLALNRSLYGLRPERNGKRDGAKTAASTAERNASLPKHRFVNAHRLVHLAGAGAVVLACPGMTLVAMVIMWPPTSESNNVEDPLQHGQIALCLLIAFILSILAVVAVVTLISPWLDRKLGVKCPGCGRSVTAEFRCQKILETGKCGFCQQMLFDPR